MESPEATEATGEELYAQAREIPHREIPDFTTDWRYLQLLGEAAEKGYPRALTKLGEYALRRKAWVEAYYWMKMAERKGMRNLEATLRDIRRRWVRRGYPNQSSNVHELFSQEEASIGRALLCVDSGHEAYAAKEYLKTYHSDLL